MTAPYSTCTACGAERTRAEWRALPLVGVWILDDGTGPPTITESRNCPCGGVPATISVDLLAVEVPYGADPGDIRADTMIEALADLQAELSRVRALHHRALLDGSRSVLNRVPVPPAPHLSRIGRDPPGYAYLARAILERSDGEVLEDEIRHELRTAYTDGRNATRTERAEVELKGAEHEQQG